MYKLMSAGPTRVADEVLRARAQAFPNPDEDADFVLSYHALCQQISKLVGSARHETLILGGEGILGLEAAIASFTEPGDRVLVLDNGVFGAGFADFVSLYGGTPLLYTTSYRSPIDPAALDAYLRTDNKFKYATLVHCDTPSGLCNDLAALVPILKRHGIYTLVDAVASMFGETVDVSCGIDLLCGGSQKVLSAPPGLCSVTISPDAWKIMQERRTPVASFYANLLAFDGYLEKRWFPYTMPASDIAGLAVAVARIAADENRVQRHKSIATACRAALTQGGLSLYPQSGYANTVTAVETPQDVAVSDILHEMRHTHGILLSGSFGPFKDKLLRIGHMGENCTRDAVQETLRALDASLRHFGAPPHKNLEESFLQALANLPSF